METDRSQKGAAQRLKTTQEPFQSLNVIIPDSEVAYIELLLFEWNAFQ